MEAEQSPAPLATGPTTLPIIPQSPQSPKTTTPRDGQFRKTPPRLRKDGERPKTGGRGAAAAAIGLARTKLWASSSAAHSKPLLPVTEQRSQEENLTGRRAKKGSLDDEKWDIAPDGGSAGREGRHFAVANVGNNGRIYLRPTVRPANQRYPQPPFVFPMTPPGTAGLEPLPSDRRRDHDDNIQGRPGTRPPLAPSTPSLTRQDSGEKHVQIRQRHRRAMSDSTVQETSVARESEPGGFKIVITQPGENERPRTVEDLDMTRTPLLEVAIPSWRIGTPRFSVRGTPFIRGSSYAPTEDIRSSRASFFNYTPVDAISSVSKTPDTTRQHHPVMPATRDEDGVRPSFPLRSTYLSTRLVIEPSMFDSLTFKPACDDRAIVRYSPAGSVTAATPPRLVAEITSPSFLDYELLSDFFLTYRSFLEPSDLLRMLFARLRWALGRSDEAGMVVRVRTFVALRHWILNYFTDDFVIDYNLRLIFCKLLNEFVDEISQDTIAKKVPLKILTELKKCWRRVCAQFWDGPEFDASLSLDIPISPGGIAGHRDPSLDPTFWAKIDTGPPQIDGLITPTSPQGHTSFYADVSRAGHIDSAVVGERPATPENPTIPDTDCTRNHQVSPSSIISVDVVSCSLPTKSMRFHHSTGYPLAAHPADLSSIYNTSSDPIATTPRALVGKRVRPHHSHKRNASLSDSLRDHATMTERIIYKNAEFLLTLPYSGSLVRGGLMPPPSQAFVEVLPGSSGAGSRQTTLFQPAPAELPKESGLVASAMSGQGMKKLLGSVRRALSTRGQALSPTQTYINISPIGPRGATTNRLPGTAIVPQSRPRPNNGARPPVRIDLLGAEIAEDFKKAVREEAAAEAEYQGRQSPPAAGSRVPGDLPEYSAAHMDTTFDFGPDFGEMRPTSDMGITTGSKSIVIVDDTLLPENYPAMTGALPAVNSNASMEAFAETFMPHGGDPTPPTTPPGRSMGTPRRSSYILGHQPLRHSVSADPLPPFIPDMATLGSESARPSHDYIRPSFDFLNHTPNRPPLSGVRGHTRQASSRSFVSNRSRGHRRYASFTSGILPQPTIRSFDATTYSEGSVVGADDSSQVMIPEPLRVLRRRPGGDLRAVTNVGELDPMTVRRSRSVGSLTTYTDSINSLYVRSPVLDTSGYVDVVTSDYSPGRNDTFSLGAITKKQPVQEKQQLERKLSLFSTHSSKPIMRPSFEAEAQKLAQIPDDVDDDGGVESALLKLEGRFERKVGAKLSMDLKKPPQIDISLDTQDDVADESGDTREEKEEHRHVHLGDDGPHPVSLSTIPTTISVQGGLLDVAGRQKRNADVQSFLSDDSRASDSTPLLERGLTDDERSKKTVTREWTDRSVFQGPDEDGATPMDGRSIQESHPSYDFILKTDSMEKMRPGDALAIPEADARKSAEQSFLDVESDHDSDLSSELSMEVIDYQDADVDPYAPSNIGIAVSTLPAHPLADATPGYQPSHRTGSSPTNPPSPPMTLIQALHLSPEAVCVPTLEDHQLWGEKPLPPTPDTTPTTAAAPLYTTELPRASPADPTGTEEALRNAPRLEIPDPLASSDTSSTTPTKLNAHLPFILAFDSDILAQQFTLIEKDALNEIDWKELIDMRWKNAEQKAGGGINSRSWVSFLRDTDARGVEVVIARFNIMVKWAISEIALTQDMEERARCLIKFIHIAAHCRRYRNFATMAQLTIALTSNEISRLTKTWSMVPASDQKTLQELEQLMSPTRNFYNLREEMEGGGKMGAKASMAMGCIPFVGIYTHDLLFNAQKPSEIASSPTGAPLVNFERCRVAAGVVKTLLRLLEASTTYEFEAVEGVTERCLWMGALEEGEIRRLIAGLE
ncbi:putative guanine nucleotide exchange factor LTE1, partial [Triangularia setosa]